MDLIRFKYLKRIKLLNNIRNCTNVFAVIKIHVIFDFEKDLKTG